MRENEAVRTTWFEDENVYYQREFAAFNDKICNDQELAAWNYDWSSPTVHIRCLRVIAQRAFKSRHESMTNYEKKTITQNEESEFEKCLEKYTNLYVPPPTRIRITKNITFNEKDVIPVYSDVPGETLKNLSLNDFFVYEYGDSNLVDKTKDANLFKALELAKEENNLIKCTCADGRCYENKDCPCFQVNHKLQAFQATTDQNKRTVFSSFKPILLTQSSNAMYDCVGFACSELCGCQGKCNNNALLLGQKNVFPIEIYRNNPDIGFCIRSPVPIPAGTPFKTFVGDLTDVKFLHHPHQDYSYEAWRMDEFRMIDVVNEMNFTQEYKNLLKDLFRHSFQVNPSKYGNVGRTAGHSCVPNCELLRVYQKSLSPAHINLVMVSLEDIIPGTPITIDYGKQYADRLKKLCGCGTFYCQNGEDKEKFEGMGFPDITTGLYKIHKRKSENYWENVQRFLVKPETAEDNLKSR